MRKTNARTSDISLETVHRSLFSVSKQEGIVFILSDYLYWVELHHPSTDSQKFQSTFSNKM